MSATGKVTTIVVWVVSALFALLFLFTGSMKLLDTEMAREKFADYGYPGWFALLIGLLEVGGGLLLLVPRLAWLGAAGLAVIMAGAAVTHLKTSGEEWQALAPFVFLVLLALVGYARWPRRAARVT
jgi:uncharacterized membrane protein YphA (DoxX/SURF4 family)